MKGRPVLGVIGGLLFGVFVALDLVFFKVVASDSILVVLLPIFGVILGVALAAWAPFGGRAPAPATAAASDAPPPDAPPPDAPA